MSAKIAALSGRNDARRLFGKTNYASCDEAILRECWQDFSYNKFERTKMERCHGMGKCEGGARAYTLLFILYAYLTKLWVFLFCAHEWN